ncbi:MAG: Cna B-type domain-containing protein [Lachnospiraceae bacterium]|nr:Cna B-type domain-containing protein [Lachnospiraceae bacterium]
MHFDDNHAEKTHKRHGTGGGDLSRLTGNKPGRTVPFGRAAALLLTVVMVLSGVVTRWPESAGIFDLWARVDDTVRSDMLPGEVEAADDTVYPNAGQAGYYSMSNLIQNGQVRANNWTSLKWLFEDVLANNIGIAAGAPVTIYINGDLTAWTSLTVPTNHPVRLIGNGSTIYRQGNDRGNDSDFGPFFIVPENAELTIDTGVRFSGQLVDISMVEVETTTTTTTTRPYRSDIRYVLNDYVILGDKYLYYNTGDGEKFVVSDQRYTASLSSWWKPLLAFDMSNGGRQINGSPSFIAGRYYTLGYDANWGNRAINGVDPTQTHLQRQLDTLSAAEKNQYIWYCEDIGGGKVQLRNVSSGKLITYTTDDGVFHLGVQTTTSTSPGTTQRWQTYPPRNLGTSPGDHFNDSNGKGYFITSSGKLNIRGGRGANAPEFFNLYLPEGYNDAAPIVINAGEFNMSGGKFYNNNVGYLADESHIVSTGQNDQSGATTPTFYDASGMASNNRQKTGTAGAIIMNGGTGTITDGIIGTPTAAENDTARLHYARNFLATDTFDGNRGSAGAVILKGSSVLTMQGGAEYPAIAGNAGSVNGTVFVTGNSTFNFYGGKLVGNFNWVGGAINVLGEGTVNFECKNGGVPRIAGNDTLQCGGGIFVGSNNVHLVSGDIYENTAADCGGGVYVRGHASTMARTLYLHHATNIYENWATSSGIDIGAVRSSSIHKDPTTRDVTTYGRSWQDIRNNNQTSDYLNNGGKNNVDKYTTGSGGGIWLCPAGSVFMGADRGTVVHIGSNHAEVQGDDFMKDNGADGGILFGDGTNAYWDSGWYLDAPVKDGQGYTDNQQRARHTWDNTNKFIVSDFTASASLKLHSENPASYGAGELNFYNNTARRGGGLGADGTIVFSKDDTTKPVIMQGQMMLQKEFVGVTEQSIRIEVALRHKTNGTTVAVGEYPLAKDAATAAAYNESKQAEDPTLYEAGYKVTFGLPHRLPGNDTLFNDTGTWNDNWEIVITEKDEDGNPISTDVMTPELGTIQKGAMSTVSQGNVTYKTATFSQNVKNIPPAEIEKYINNVVHHDVIAENEVFEFEIMAKMEDYAQRETTSFIITDTLQDELTFCDVNGNITTDFNSVVRDIYWMEPSDHDGTGNGSVVNNEGAYIGNAALITRKEISGQTLTVGFIPNRLNENWKLPGKWVRIRFYARFKDSASYQKALTNAENQAASGYADLSEGTGANERVYWRNVTDNAPLTSVLPAQEEHTGVENHAHLYINYGNGVTVEQDSNTVTVKPKEPTIEKYVNDVVHADLANFNENFTYDIIAYVPEGATEVVITDTLIRELEFCGRGGMAVSFRDEGGARVPDSTNFNNVIFNSQNQNNRFDIRTTNDHLGNGQGTVSNRNGVSATFDATMTNGTVTGNGRLQIEETTDGRQRLTLHLTSGTEGNANEVFEAMDRNGARWIHFSFKARIRPEYYTEIANKLKGGDLSANTAIGWDVIDTDGTVLSGAARQGAGGTPSVIDYANGGTHAGELNNAQMRVTVTNAASSATGQYESNTVTVKPEMTSLSVTKDWLNTTTAQLHFEGDYVPYNEDGIAFMRAFANSMALQVTQSGNDNGNGEKTPEQLGFGDTYEIADVARLNGQAGTDTDARHWVITYRKKGTTAEQDESPITLTITTSNGVFTSQGTTRISWELKWENLPKLSNGTWQVTETRMENDGFEAPVYSGIDTGTGQSLTYAAQGDRISNTHKNDETTSVYVEKKWVNADDLQKDWVSLVLFARFTGDNGSEVIMAIDSQGQTGQNAGAQGKADWSDYGNYFPNTIKRYSAFHSGDDGRAWMQIGPSNDPDLNWKGYWTGLPLYLNGDETRPITYEVREGSLNAWPGGNSDSAFYRVGGNENNFSDFLFYNRGKDYTYSVTGGKITVTNEQGNPETVYNYTLTNEKTVVEKYVNQAVHAELPAFDDVFTYDILAYIPADAESAVITDTLPVALEFVDDQNRTLYAYNESTGRSDTVNGNFNKNNVIYSAYGNGVGRYNLVSNNDHLGNGAGTASGTNAGNVSSFAASAVNYDVATKTAAGVLIEATNKDAPQTLTIALNTDGNQWVFNALDEGKRWVHIRFNVRIRPEYYDEVIASLASGTPHASLNWDTISKDNTLGTYEKVDGDGTVKGGLAESNKSYFGYGSAHAGISNYTSLQVSNYPDIVYSNTVTVTPKTTEILVYKYWRDIETPDQIGYYNYTDSRFIYNSNVPYGTDPNGADGIAFMTALANSFMLSDDPVSQTAVYADYFEGWTMQAPVREMEYLAADPSRTAYAGSARPSGTGERKPWYVTWKNAQGETHPSVLVILTDHVKGDYLGTGSADTYRWKLVWYNLPDNGRTYHVTETQLTGFDAPVHPESSAGKGYATNGGGIRNTRLNDERLYVDVHKEWVNINPGNANNTSVVVRLVARKADGTIIPADDITFTQGNGGQPFNISNITLNAANGWEGGWPLLPKYYRNDSQKLADNLITYTVEEVSYTQDGQPVSTGSGYSWSVRDNATGKVINRNGTANDTNITFGDATVTNYDYTLVNEKPAIEKYVNQAVHAELPAFNDIFTYDIVAYVPEGYTTITIRDPLPAALEFVDSAGNSMYTYNIANGSYTRNTSFNKNRVVYSPVGTEYNKIDGWKTNDHIGSGEGYVANLQAHENDGARMQTYTIGDSNMDITAADGASAQTLTINLGSNHGRLVKDSNDNHGVWIHLRFNARIRPEYYLAIINRMALTSGGYNTTTDPALGWAIVSNDGYLAGEKTDGDGTVIQGRKQTAEGTYVSYGTRHEGEGNYAELVVDNQPEIYSNTVTVVPKTTDIVIDKRWIGTSAADHFFLQSGYVELAKGIPYIKALAEHFIVSSANVPDITKYGGTWTMNDPVRSGSDWSNWTITWSRTENGQTVTAPVKLLIRTDITPRTFADGNTGICWTFTWSGLPMLENPATGAILPWNVAENGAFSYIAAGNRITYDTPVYKDTEDNILAGAATAGGSVTNIRIHDDTTRVAVNKQWRNISPSGNNPDPSNPTTYVEVGLVATYTAPDGTKVTITDIASDAFFASKNVTGTLKLIPEGSWEDAFENLPRYYQGHLAQEISYSVVEKRAVDNGVEITGFTSRVTDNAAGDGYTIINEKEVIEKYVNSAVHAEIPQFDDVFEYDLMVYVPADATSLTITDTLPTALEYVDTQGRTLYTYGGTDAGGNAIRTQNTGFNAGNSLIRSVRGENPQAGSADLWIVFDHDGSGNGHIGNVTQHEADAGAMKGTMALRDGAVQVTATDKDAAQTMTITLNGTDDADFFSFVNRYDTRWVQIHFAARIRPEYYARIVTRITEDHETFISATDPALGWAIVASDGTVENNHMEMVDGDGTVTNAHMQTASGAYTPLANIHAGEGNYASLAINNNARAVYSNTVTVVPFTEELTVDKLWAETGSVQRPSKETWKDSLVLHSKLTLNGAVQDYELEAKEMTPGATPDTWTGEVTLPGSTNVTVTLTIRESASNPNRWEAVWSGLPRLNNTHYYTVTENALDGYVTAYDNSDTSLTGFTLGEEAASNGDIVNTQREVEIPVTKLWRDTTPSDRPDSIRLIVTGTATYGSTNQFTHTVTKEAVIGPTPVIDNTDPNNPVYTYTWPDSGSVATITGLPMYFYDAGEKTWHLYTYTVREASVSGYLPTDADGNVLTGTGLDIPVSGAAGDASRPVTLYNTEETQLRIIKNWRDADNAAGRRPSSIEVIVRGTNPNTHALVYNGTQTATVLTESETLGWTYTLTGLPKYCDDNQTPVKYTVEEVLTSLPTDYRIVGEATAEAEADTTNPGAWKAELTNEELTDLTINKTWHAATQADKVVFHVYATTVTPATDPSDPSTITQYAITSDPANGYSVQQGNTMYVVELTPPATAADTWSETISGLPKYAPDTGLVLNYYVKEYSVKKGSDVAEFNADGKATADGVTWVMSPNTYTTGQNVVNGTVSFTNTAETTLKITKTWAKADPSDTTAFPEVLTFKVTGTVTGEGGSTLTVFPETTYKAYVKRGTDAPAGVDENTDILATEDTTSGTVWTGITIPDLKTHHTDGQRITYTVTEVVPDGYRATPESTGVIPADGADSVAITNTKVATTRVRVEKIWSPLPTEATQRNVKVHLVATITTASGDVRIDNTNCTTEQDNYPDLRDAVSVAGGWEKTLDYASDPSMTAEWNDLPRGVVRAGDSTNTLLPVSYTVIETQMTATGYTAKEPIEMVSTTGDNAKTVTLINAKPAIEKYVNLERPVDASARPNPTDPVTGLVTQYSGDDGGVHTDLNAFNEVFTYDVQAYVTHDADRVVITDTLNEAIMLVDVTGAAVVAGNLTTEIHVAAKDGNADGSAPALSSRTGYVAEGGFGLPAGAITKTMTVVTSVSGKEFQKLSVEINLLSDTFASDEERDALRGKWIHITFNARIKPSYLTPEALVGIQGDVLANVDGYRLVQQTEDEPVEDAKMNRLNVSTWPYTMTYRPVDYGTDPTVEHNHTGAINGAHYEIWFDNAASAAYDEDSNIVTVDPPVTSVTVTKEWQGTVPASIDETYIQTFLSNFVLHRSDHEADAYLWGSADYDATAPEQTYQWTTVSLMTGSTTKYIVKMEPKTGVTQHLDPADVRSVVVDTDPDGDSSTNDPWKIIFSGLPLITGLDYYVTEKDHAFIGYQNAYYDNSASAVTGAVEDGAYHEGRIVNTQETDITVTKAWQDSSGNSVAAPTDAESVSAELTATYTYDDPSTTPATAHTVVITKDTATDNGTVVATPDAAQTALQALLIEKTCGASESWQAKWEHLPSRIDTGTSYAEIKYSVAETKVTMTNGTESAVDSNRVVVGITNPSFYEVIYDSANTAGLSGASAATTITNRETWESVSVKAIKSWNPSAPSGAQITLELVASYQNGTNTVTLITNPGTGEVLHPVFIHAGSTIDTAPRTLDGTVDTIETTAWEASWSGLPKYIIVGNRSVSIDYTVRETTTTDNYITTVGTPVVDVSGNVEIHVTNTQDKTTLSLTKAWQDAAGNAAAPSLAAGVTDTEVETYVRAFAENLMLFNTAAPETDLLAAISTTPVITPPDTTLSPPADTTWTVVWSDGTDSITLKINTGAPATGTPEKYWSASSWSLTFEGLPYNNGATYGVKEKAPLTGYMTGTYKDGANAVSAHAPANGTITNRQQDATRISASVTKDWSDESNLDGSRLPSVTFHLYATTQPGDATSFRLVQVKNTASGMPEVTTYTEEDYKNNTLGTSAKDDFDIVLKTTDAVTGNDNRWTMNVGNLPQYDLSVAGTQTAYTYRLREVTDLTGTGYAVTNATATPADIAATTGSASTPIAFAAVENEHTPEKTEIPVTKTWEDGLGAARDADTEITLTLTATRDEDGTVIDIPNVTGPVTLKKNSTGVTVGAGDTTWSYTFTDLPKTFEGKAVTYSVTETGVSAKYAYELTTPAAKQTDGSYHTVQIKNTLEINVSVKKAWDDDNYSGRPSDEELKAALTLYVLDETDPANPVETAVDAALIPSGQPLVTGTGNDRIITWNGLLYPGEKCTYVVKEKADAFTSLGYFAPIYPGTPSQGYAKTHTVAAQAETITNRRYDTGTVGLSLTKNWSDNSNQDGIRPTEATFILVAGLNPAGADSAFYMVDVTNPLDPSIAWDYRLGSGDTLFDYYDNMSDTNKRKYHITIKKDDTDTDNNAASWTYAEIRNLPKYAFVNGTQHAYTYRLIEVDVAAGYTPTQQPAPVTIDGSTAATITFTATNTHTPGTTEITVNKSWVGDENNGHNTRKQITIQLEGYVDGTLLAGSVQTKTLPEGGGTDLSDSADWSVIFTDLPQYHEGKKIIWRVEEVDDPSTWTPAYTVSGSPAEIDGTTATTHNVTITNTINRPDPTDIVFTKTWADTDIGWVDYSAGRPSSLTLTLTQSVDGGTTWTAVDGDPQPVETTDTNGNPVYTWENLPKTTIGGTAITYRVTEAVPQGYVATNTADGTATNYVDLSATNSFAAGLTNTLDTTDITLTKEWDHGTAPNASPLSARPAEITVTVTGTYNNGLAIPNATFTYKIGPGLTDNLSANPRTLTTTVGTDGNWSAVTIKNLPKYYLGNPITWTVTESTVTAYEQTYTPENGRVNATGANTDVTIKNTYTTTNEYVSISGTKTWIINPLRTRSMSAMSMRSSAPVMLQMSATVEDPVNGGTTEANVEEPVQLFSVYSDATSEEYLADESENKIVADVTAAGSEEEPEEISFTLPEQPKYDDDGEEIIYELEDVTPVETQEMQATEETPPAHAAREDAPQPAPARDSLTYTVTDTEIFALEEIAEKIDLAGVIEWSHADSDPAKRPDTVYLRVRALSGRDTVYEAVYAVTPYESEQAHSPYHIDATVDIHGAWHFTIAHLDATYGGRVLDYTVQARIDAYEQMQGTVTYRDDETLLWQGAWTYTGDAATADNHYEPQDMTEPGADPEDTLEDPLTEEIPEAVPADTVPTDPVPTVMPEDAVPVMPGSSSGTEAGTTGFSGATGESGTGTGTGKESGTESGMTQEGTPDASDDAGTGAQDGVLGDRVEVMSVRGEIFFDHGDNNEADIPRTILLHVTGESVSAIESDMYYTVTIDDAVRIAGGVQAYEAGGVWSFVIPGLKLYNDNDEKITYTVMQITDPDTDYVRDTESFTLSYETNGNAVMDYVLYNIYELPALQTVDIAAQMLRAPVVMRPLGASVQQNTTIPDTITVQVTGKLADGTTEVVGPVEYVIRKDDTIAASGNVITMTASGDNWTFTINGDPATNSALPDLPKKWNGEDVYYTIEEIKVDGKEIATSGYTNVETQTPAASSAVGTNNLITYNVSNALPQPEQVSLTVTKKWLRYDNTEITGVDLNGLPAVVVVLQEREMGTTTWKDVTEDGTATGKLVALELNASNNWTASFTGLEKHTDLNKTTLYEYTVREATAADTNLPAGMTATDLSTIRFTHDAATGVVTQHDNTTGGTGNFTSTVTNRQQTPEFVDIRMTKLWADDTGEEDKRSDVTFRLYYHNGTSYVPYPDAATQKTVVLRAADYATSVNPWSGTEEKNFFRDLPKYDLLGRVMRYQVREEAVAGYTPTYSVTDGILEGTAVSGAGTGTAAAAQMTVTNTKIPSVDIAVRKVWKNANGTDMDAQQLAALESTISSVTVQLRRRAGTSGAFTDVPGKTATLTKTGQGTSEAWAYVFTDLEQTDGAGVPYEYTVVETRVTGTGGTDLTAAYTATYADVTGANVQVILTATGNPADGETVITNTVRPDEPPIIKTVNDKTHADLALRDEVFTYKIVTQLPLTTAGTLTHFVITDTLESVLEIAGTSATTQGITVSSLSQSDVTVTVNGARVTETTGMSPSGTEVSMVAFSDNNRTLTVSLPAAYLTGHGGEEVIVTFRARIRAGASLAAYTDEKVPNTATYRFDNTSKTSNEVTVKPPKEDPPGLTKTVNGQQTYKLQAAEETLTYEIMTTIPQDAKKFSITDEVPEVLQVTGMLVIVDGQVISEQVLTNRGQNVTMSIEDAAPYRGKTIKIQITTEFKPGADLSAYTRYNVDNNATMELDGRNYSTSEPARVNGEVLSGVRTRETAQYASRGGNTGEEDLLRNHLILLCALFSMILLLAAGHGKRL